MKKPYLYVQVIVVGALAIQTFSGCTPKMGATGTGIANVTTYHNDLGRTGQNLNEISLTPANVKTSTFGKIATLPVDDTVYAQPLVLNDVQVNGTSKNLVFVVTENDSVYAFDIDAATAADGASNTPVWQRSFLGDAEYPCPATTCTALTINDTFVPNIYPNTGITSTPVIDPSTGKIYIVATTKEDGLIYWKLHILDVATGAEQVGTTSGGGTAVNSPVVIKGSVPGSAGAKGYSAATGNITFQPQHQLSRAGLALANGTVYIAFSSYDDNEPVHGWIFAYDEASFAQIGIFNTTPQTGEGSIWMSGGAPAVDEAGNVFVATSNSDQSISTPFDLGESVLKLSLGSAKSTYGVGNGIQLDDYFTPSDRLYILQGDVDLGSGGVVVLPDQPGTYPHLLVAGGKEGSIYLLNRDNLGKFNSADKVVDEQLRFFGGGQSDGPGLYGTPSYFNGSVYWVPWGGVLTSVPISGGKFGVAQVKQSTIVDKIRGATTSISAANSGGSGANAIAWYIDTSAYYYNYAGGSSGSAGTSSCVTNSTGNRSNGACGGGGATAGTMTILSNGPGVLTAYDLSNLSTPLYQSSQVAEDAAGSAVKFSTPTVADGLVFVGAQQEVSVYGLKDRSTSPLAPSSSTSASAKNKNGSRSFASLNPHPIQWLERVFSSIRKMFH